MSKIKKLLLYACDCISIAGCKNLQSELEENEPQPLLHTIQSVFTVMTISGAVVSGSIIIKSKIINF